MVELGYDVTTIGVEDLYMGLDYFREVFGNFALPIVSANIYDESTGELVVEPYVIIEKAGVRFGVTGVMDHNTNIRTKRGEVESPGVTMTDFKEAVREIIPELSEKCDHVVVLAHMSKHHAEALVEQVSGIDIVVVGLQANPSMTAYERQNVMFIQPGNRGQHIADYRLSFDEEGVLQGYEGDVVKLDDKVPADAAMALKLKEHKQIVDAMRKEAAAARARELEERRAERGGYQETCLGVEASCTRCHAEQYEHWEGTPHAHAYATLQEKFQASNPECLRCHTTCQLDLKPDGSEVVPEELRNVQCESCHGMGTEHARDGSYGAIRVETCLKCHDKENSPDFSFATYLPKVTH
ncbi:MAG: hypothetical protein GF400_05690 [Candidatus Eisenbacteria bacterium]|nr:hypothetical protein [Candidatus Eisenbacteria bacterium]